MTDLEMTKLCAEAMGLSSLVAFPTVDSTHMGYAPPQYSYNPLHDDAQCFALVKRFKLNIGQLSIGMCKVFTGDMRHEADDGDLNYAIVKCVAKMQSERSK